MVGCILRVALSLPGISWSTQAQSRNSISGQSSMSIQITGSSSSLPWSCQVPFGREDDVAAVGLAALAFDDWCSRPCRTGWCGWRSAMHVRRRDVARIVDRDRAADGVGDLQPAVEARDWSAGCSGGRRIRSATRRPCGRSRRCGEIRAVFLPAPAMGRRLHLVGGDAAAGELARCPSPPVSVNQGRCAGAFAWVRTQTLSLAASALISSINSRALLESAAGRWVLGGHGHDVLSCSRAISAPICRAGRPYQVRTFTSGVCRARQCATAQRCLATLTVSALRKSRNRAGEGLRLVDVGDVPGAGELDIARARQRRVELAHGRRRDAVLLADHEQDRPRHRSRPPRRSRGRRAPRRSR